MAPFCNYCSIDALYHLYLRWTFRSAGLEPKLIPIDSQTVFHCWTTPPLNRTKPALLLLHGFGPTAIFQWKHQVRHLSNFFSLYVPDLLFFGESATKSAERSEIFQARCMGELMERLGVERYSVAGTSYGGFVAYHMARVLGGERVEKVVLASSGVNKRARDNDELVEKAKVGRVWDLMLPTKAAELQKLMSLAMFRPPRIPNFALNSFIKGTYMQNREEKIELLKAISLGKDDNLHVSPLKQEVLIIWGEYDQIFPLEQAYELKSCIGENVRLEVMKDTSHIPQIENPKLFNEIITDFLLASR